MIFFFFVRNKEQLLKGRFRKASSGCFFWHVAGAKAAAPLLQEEDPRRGFSMDSTKQAAQMFGLLWSTFPFILGAVRYFCSSVATVTSLPWLPQGLLHPQVDWQQDSLGQVTPLGLVPAKEVLSRS